jgi:hypothetical protein
MSLQTAKASYYWNGLLLKQIGAPSFDPKGDSAEPVFGMAPSNRAFAHRIGQRPAWTIAFSTPVMKTDQEYDWQTAARAKTEGQFMVVTSLKSEVYVDCVVVSCQSKGDPSRGLDWAVTISALDVQPV